MEYLTGQAGTRFARIFIKTVFRDIRSAQMAYWSDGQAPNNKLQTTNKFQ